MNIPKGWKIIETGNGASEIYRAIPDSVLEWSIVDRLDPVAPTDPSEQCRLYLNVCGGQLVVWHCSCVAEAVQIANSAKA